MAKEYTCKTCGWSGLVNGQQRCLACARRNVAKWRKNNPGKHLAQKRRYDKKARTERREEYNQRRRRHKRPATNAAAWKRRILWLAGGDVTREQLIEIYETAKGLCSYCGAKVHPRFNPLDPRGYDHVKPRAKNGKHTKSNIVVCCKNCNALKSDK